MQRACQGPRQADQRPLYAVSFIKGKFSSPQRSQVSLAPEPQVTMSATPVPTQARLTRQSAHYLKSHGQDYFLDALRAYRAVGLLRTFKTTPDATGATDSTGSTADDLALLDVGDGIELDRAFVYPSIAPFKDMEVSCAEFWYQKRLAQRQVDS